MTKTPILLAAAALAAAALTVPALGGRAALPTGNLLQNPGAEAAAGAKDYEVVALPGWQTSPGFTALRYKPKALDLPSTDDAARLGGGANYFAGGGDRAASASATQTVDISAESRIVDAGTVVAKLGALVGGSRAQEDNGTVEAVFLDASGAPLGKVAVGPVTAEQRKRITNLLPLAASAPVPPGTRAMRVTMTATRIHGSYNEAIFDNLSLALAEQPAPQAALSLARGCGTKPSVNATVKATGALRIASVAFSSRGTKAVDSSAPFTARLPLARGAKSATVTALVTDVADRTTRLAQTVKGC